MFFEFDPETAGDIYDRDATLDLPDPYAAEAKAELPPTEVEPPTPTPTPAPTPEPEAPEDVIPEQPTPAAPGPGAGRDERPVPPTPAPEPEPELPAEPAEPEPAGVEPEAKPAKEPKAQKPTKLAPPKTQAQAWMMLLGIGDYDGGLVGRVKAAGDRRKMRKVVALRRELDGLLRDLGLDEDGRNVVTVRNAEDDDVRPTGDTRTPPAAPSTPARVQEIIDAYEEGKRRRDKGLDTDPGDDVVVVESGVYPEPPTENAPEANSPMDTLASEVLDDLVDEGWNSPLTYPLNALYDALRKGELADAFKVFEERVEPGLIDANKTAKAEAWRARLFDMANDMDAARLAPEALRSMKPDDFPWRSASGLGEGWEVLTPQDRGALLSWAQDRRSEAIHAIMREAVPAGLGDAFRANIDIVMRVHGDHVPHKVYRNKEKNLEIVVSDPIEDEWTKHAVTVMDEIRTIDPTEGVMRVTLFDNERPNRSKGMQNHEGLYGHAIAGGNIMGINVARLRQMYDRKPGPGFMPVAYSEDPEDRMRYAFWHEYGHVRGPLMLHGDDTFIKAFTAAIKDAGLKDPREAAKAFYWNNTKYEYRWSNFFKGVNDFRSPSGSEAYAEFYAEWMLTKGETRTPTPRCSPRWWGSPTSASSTPLTPRPRPSARATSAPRSRTPTLPAPDSGDTGMDPVRDR